MGSLGFQELALIMLVSLVLFGPKRLPEIARMLGRSIREFRKAASEFSSALTQPGSDDGGTER